MSGRFCVTWGVVLLLISPRFLYGQQLQRRIDFRDGTTLEVTVLDQPLTWKNISRDGMVTEQKIPAADIERILLVPEPSTARVARIRKLLTLLGSEDYHQRDLAQKKLVETGKEFERIIEQYVPTDEETKWRITKVRKKLEEKTSDSPIQSTFDVLTLKGADKPLEGELDLSSLEVRFGSARIQVTRDSVASISNEKLQTNFAVSGSEGGGKREQFYPDANGTMPPDFIYVDFEKFPNGKSMTVNADVSNAFVDVGVKFATSITNSYVSSQSYGFTDGRGGSYSIANYEPTYEGVLTITFCVPGNSSFAAGTHYVGFNVAHVDVNGTFFEAYDPQGQLITRFATDQTGTDYLGFRSKVPIAKVVVRPNLDVDADFALDDLFFEKPVALLESGNPKFFNVVTRKGERLQCDSVEINSDSILLKNLSIGIPQLPVDWKDVWVMVPPQIRLKKPSTDPMSNSAYCLLNDGAIVLAQLPDLLSARFQVPIKRDQLVAVWGLSQQLTAAPTFKIKPGAATVSINGDFVDLAEVKLGKTWLESPTIAELKKRADDRKKTGAEPEGDLPAVDLTETRWADSPCIFFQAPKANGGKTGVLYTYDGERYFVDSQSIGLRSGQDGFSLTRSGKTVQLAWDEIRVLRFP